MRTRLATRHRACQAGLPAIEGTKTMVLQDERASVGSSDQRLHDNLIGLAALVAVGTLLLYGLWSILPPRVEDRLVESLVAAVARDDVVRDRSQLLHDLPIVVLLHGFFLAIILRQAAKGFESPHRGEAVHVGPTVAFMAYLVAVHFATENVPTLVWLYAEDQPLEQMTALFSAAAGFLMIRASLGLASARSRSILVVLGGSAILFALEEISWGQRVFDFSSPQVFEAHNDQGETNLHNFANPVLDPATAALCVLVAAYLLFMPRISRVFPADIRPLFMPENARAMVPIFLAAAWLAYVWDGELAEELISVLMLASAWRYARVRRLRGAGRSMETERPTAPD